MMTPLTKVYDATLLSRRSTYQIDGRLYKFLGSDPYANIQSPQYKFRPLAGQKRRSDLVLNHRKLMALVYEVPGMQVFHNASATDVQTAEGIQLALF